MKHLSTEELFQLNTKARRNLSMKDLKQWYTSEELDKLGFKVYPENRTPLLCNIKYQDNYEKLRAIAAKQEPKLLVRWTPKEDDFLRATYAYLSDQTIALALNMPDYAIKLRRATLGLLKDYRVNLDVVVWCNRDNYEEDMLKESLTKARPDILDTLIEKDF